ncbi:hypothetical protein ABPG75_005781 [Micractinium tetrahymenae]
MGWMANVIAQGVISFVILGSLKRAGVIRVDARAIDNPGLRSVFEQGLTFGETVASYGERMIAEFKKVTGAG